MESVIEERKKAVLTDKFSIKMQTRYAKCNTVSEAF